MTSATTTAAVLLDEAEMTVIGSVFADPARLTTADDAHRLLAAEDFHHQEHAIIWRAILQLLDQGAEPDVWAVKVELKCAGELEAAGGEDYLARIVETVPTAANLPSFAARVREAAQHRRDALFLERALRVARGDGRNWGKARAELMEQLAKSHENARRDDERAPLVRSLADLLTASSCSGPEAVAPRLAWRGRISLLAAREKVGKSTLATAAAARVSRGEHFLGEPTSGGRVLYVALEEHPDDVAARFVDFGADSEQVLVMQRPHNPLADLQRAVRELKPALVVLDSLAKWCSLNGLKDACSSAQATAVMSGLEDLARDFDTAVLILHHSKKNNDGGYRDSSAFAAVPDIVLEMADAGGALRDLRCRGRWTVPDFSVRLSGRPNAEDPREALGYVLVKGEPSLEVRIRRAVEAHPGASMRALRGQVSGRAATIQVAVDRMIDGGSLEDRGQGNALALYAVPEKPDGDKPGTAPGSPDPGGSAPGNRLGTTSGTAKGRTGSGSAPISGNQEPVAREMEI